MITVVIPARNEARTIKETLGQLRRLEPLVLQTIVVDDYSTDGTAEEAQRWGSVLRTYTIQNKGRPGYGSAIRTGLAWAAEPWVTIMTADGSDNPADLCTMAEQATSQMVFGDR